MIIIIIIIIIIVGTTIIIIAIVHCVVGVDVSSSSENCVQNVNQVGLYMIPIGQEVGLEGINMCSNVCVEGGVGRQINDIDLLRHG